MNTSHLNHLAAVRLVVGLALAVVAGDVAQAVSATPDCAPFQLGQKARAEQSIPAAFAHYKRAVADSCKVAESLRALAELSMGLDRPDKAETYNRELISWVVRHGGRETAADRVGLGLALMRLGRPQEAANELQQAERLDPVGWTTMYGRARLAMANGNWTAATDLMERTGAAKSKDPVVIGQYNVVMALYYQGIDDFPQAESAALRAVSLDPTDPERLALFHRICAQRGTLGVGIGALEQAKIDAGVKPPAPLLAELGRMYEAGRRYNEARDMYVAAVTADSSYAPALRDLGDLMQIAKKPAIAAQFYLRYLGQVPNDVDATMSLAQVCTDLGQTDEAAKAMRSAVTMAPTRRDVRRAFARAGLRSSDPTTSSAAVNVFNSLAGDSLWTVDDWLALAEYHRERKVLDAARQATARAAAVEPMSAQIEFELGLIEITAGNPDAAVTHMQAAVDRNPEGPNYHLNLGVALVTAGRRADGIAAMRRSVGINEKFTQGRLVLAQTLTAADSTRASDEQYQAILAYDPANDTALRGLGWSRLKAADCKEAVRLFTTASESGPKNAENWVGLGSAAVCANDHATAAKAFEKARQIDPESASVKKGLDLLAQARKGSTP